MWQEENAANQRYLQTVYFCDMLIDTKDRPGVQRVKDRNGNRTHTLITWVLNDVLVGMILGANANIPSPLNWGTSVSVDASTRTGGCMRRSESLSQSSKRSTSSLLEGFSGLLARLYREPWNSVLLVSGIAPTSL
eukprot:gb/GECG01004960.1/.p1 GENE.gb/GECG01004960.1/~~gb/GECG01004960.1/.p1  ORF type:complete len:135 (+),score=11.51 gb/GECG01004960.1/:1-405(+)